MIKIILFSILIRSVCLEQFLDSSNDEYNIGVGIADITGPAAQTNMMGYAKVGQDTAGIHFRLFSRAFVIEDKHGNRICFVSADLCMIDTLTTLEVVKRLKKYEGLYTEKNVMLTSTHTHSGSGGYLQYALYSVTTGGFIRENFYAIADGIVRSIDRAHSRMAKARIYFNRGNLFNASINRSPTAYENNPNEEKAKYELNTDKTMYVFKFIDLNGEPIGMISWFAVHCTSMNNTNTQISGDNKGYASQIFERGFNVDQLPGKGPFVAAFANANLGDVSPNINGPHCSINGASCDNPTSTCSIGSGECIASGPGADMFESTRIIAERQYEKAKELFELSIDRLAGGIASIHQYIDMTNVSVPLPDGSNARTCKPALGMSFAAGTTDGPGVSIFKQGISLSNVFTDQIHRFTNFSIPDLSECHYPKPILLPTGLMKVPYDWTAEILPTQIFKIGNFFIVAVPAEFSTMSGRRLRESLVSITKSENIIITGPSNAYSHYVTTFEEYQVQRYEGASTIYGPHTLSGHISQFEKLMTNLLSGIEIEPGPSPPNLLSRQIESKNIVAFDSKPLNSKFGDCKQNVDNFYAVGSTVTVTFISANPRNNLMIEKSFLTVEYFNESSSTWQIVASDVNYETNFIWEEKNKLLHQSKAIIKWNIPTSTSSGTYKIRHFGYHKNILGQTQPFSGETNEFYVL
ncbi:neutral ceramidase-like protein [Dinothrombium tinctorium]|uniref:Neutral ceramidase n=1 Tax=Dinothrombium tinctorium TaxID=1965070 RepID=A0A3S3QK27_9ACAR|nr:neutral ceramidase-like protein [Dinothrombium tinctorium]